MQLGKYLDGFPLWPLIFYPYFLYLFTSCDKFSTSLVSWVFVAANSVMDEVRVELVLTNSSNVVLPAVATMVKQISNS